MFVTFLTQDLDVKLTALSFFILSPFPPFHGKLTAILFITNIFMRLFILILFAVLALFQYDLWFGRNGFFDYRDTAAKIVENQAENEKLSQRNQRINAEIQGLTKGFEAIEERARMQHGMVKENEVFYHIVKENK